VENTLDEMVLAEQDELKELIAFIGGRSTIGSVREDSHQIRPLGIPSKTTAPLSKKVDEN
jgi:hypothetical protein